MTCFHGSYLESDVDFLLKRIDAPSTCIEEKERLIQSGQRHYSEMITKESLPTAKYMSLFRQSVEANGKTMAQDVFNLACHIKQMKGKSQVTLVSLARAGTPVGVLLKRVLSEHLNTDSKHYSVSIIRDRGIDTVAIETILAQGRSPESIIFIDGWTGKGVISHELTSSISKFNDEHGVKIDTGLYVLNDLAGTAAWCSSADDYLIPSSILNATVSGLISRSILNSDFIGETDFHGCIYYSEYEAEDLSLWFVDQIMKYIAECRKARNNEADPKKAHRAITSQKFLKRMQHRFSIKDINLIKPGIGESTRVMLRRVPDTLVLKDIENPSIAHLRVLAGEKKVPVIVDPDLLYNAVSIIREVD